MVYFDNAATGGHKPKQVIEAVAERLKKPANPGRASHKRAIEALETVIDARENLLKLFSAQKGCAVFTKNCTEALNIAIMGTLNKGGHIVSSVLEHNSVLRPLFELEREGLIEKTLIAPDKDGSLSADAVKEALRENTYAVILTAASNVTGGGARLTEIGRLCRERGLLFIVDAAQAAGHADINMPLFGIDILCVPGHKGLLGPSGTGALVLAEGVSAAPLMFGGTGTESHNTFQPEIYPEALESGTLNVAGIAGLNEGVKYILRNGKLLVSKLKLLTGTLKAGLCGIPYVKLFSTDSETGIFSFLLSSQPSTDTADLLSEKYGIAVRAGLHCAPLAHKYLGTEDSGLVRASLSPFNSISEIKYLLNVLEKHSAENS